MGVCLLETPKSKIASEWDFLSLPPHRPVVGVADGLHVGTKTGRVALIVIEPPVDVIPLLKTSECVPSSVTA